MPEEEEDFPVGLDTRDFKEPMTVAQFIWVVRALGIGRGTGGIPRHAPPGVAQSAIRSLEQGIHIPQNASEAVATAMRVPTQFLRLGAHYVEQSVRVTRQVHRYAELELYGKQSRAEVRRVFRAARELMQTIEQLGDVAREKLDRAVGSKNYSVENLEAYKDHVRELLEAAAATGRSRPKKSEAHRPPGSAKNPALVFLLRDLDALLVQYLGGELTYRKANGQLRGTAPAVLNVLRPHLPGIIPERLSYSTLRRALLQ